jgi:DNA-binding protein YbaB
VEALQDLIQAAFHDAEGQLSDPSIHPAMPMGFSMPF